MNTIRHHVEMKGRTRTTSGPADSKGETQALWQRTSCLVTLRGPARARAPTLAPRSCRTYKPHVAPSTVIYQSLSLPPKWTASVELPCIGEFKLRCLPQEVLCSRCFTIGSPIVALLTTGSLVYALLTLRSPMFALLTTGRPVGALLVALLWLVGSWKTAPDKPIFVDVLIYQIRFEENDCVVLVFCCTLHFLRSW